MNQHHTDIDDIRPLRGLYDVPQSTERLRKESRLNMHGSAAVDTTVADPQGETSLFKSTWQRGGARMTFGIGSANLVV